MKYIIITAIVILIGLFGLHKWKKKYRYPYPRPAKKPDRSTTAGIASQIIDIPKEQTHYSLRKAKQGISATGNGGKKTTPKGKGQPFNGSKRNP